MGDGASWAGGKPFIGFNWMFVLRSALSLNHLNMASPIAARTASPATTPPAIAFVSTTLYMTGETLHVASEHRIPLTEIEPFERISYFRQRGKYTCYQEN